MNETNTLFFMKFIAPRLIILEDTFTREKEDEKQIIFGKKRFPKFV